MPDFLFIAANEWPNWGGSELLWSATAEKLAQLGHQVRVNVPSFAKSTAIVNNLRSAGCKVSLRKPAPAPLAYRISRKILPLPEYSRIQFAKCSSGADLIVISQGCLHDGLPWTEAARAKRLKYALILQGASELSWPDDEHARKLAIGYESAVRTYFVSNANLELVRYQLATPLTNARLVGQAFNVKYDVSLPWPESVDELRLACIGRLDGGGKGHDLLFRALALDRWRGRNLQVSLIGKGSSERVLRSMVESLRLRNINFVGHQGDIEGIWRTHHALVFPSRYEGMPLVVLEAMLCGRVCIATDVGGSGEVIRDGHNGFLIKAPTVALLDEAMERAWNCRERLQEMGQLAATDVKKWASPDPARAFADELINIVTIGR